MKQEAVHPLEHRRHSARNAPKNRDKNGPVLLTIPPSTRAKVMTNYGKLPLSFEANEGQTDSKVQFLSRGNGYAVFLEASEATLALHEVAQGFSPATQDMTLRSAVATRRQGVTEGCRPFDSLLAAYEEWRSRCEPFEGFFNTNVRRPVTEPLQERYGRNLPSPEPNSTVLRLKLLGANSLAKGSGLAELPGKSNYFIGNDASKWRTNVSSYAKVRYQNVYPGTDLVYYGNQRQLEYDFVVKPGADPKAIKVSIEGADEVRIDSAGDLVVNTADGEVRFLKPLVYQTKSATGYSVLARASENGPRTTDELNPKSTIENRQFLDGRYILTDNNQIVFDLPAYDSSRPLVIDPTVTYAAFLGGGIGYPYGGGSEIAVDSQGNAFVTGETRDPNFPTTTGAYQRSLTATAPNGNAFVTKLNPSCTALVYSTFLGGNQQEFGIAIAVDGSGNAYVTGATLSADFPTTTIINQSCRQDSFNVFVTELNSEGSGLVYSTCLNGNNEEFGRGTTVNKSTGKIFVTGFTTSTNFPTKNAYQNVNNGKGCAWNAFVTELDPTQAGDASLIYSSYLGGSTNCTPFEESIGLDVGYGVALDPSGYAYVVGQAFSTDFPTLNPLQSPATACMGSAGSPFVAKFDTTQSGSASLIYSTCLSGTGSGYLSDWGEGIAVDASGNAYVTGLTSSTNFPTTSNAFQLSNKAPGSQGGNAFVTVLGWNSPALSLVYSTYLGGSGGDSGYGIAVMPSGGDIYVTGGTVSTDFPVMNAFQPTYGGNGDAFMTELDPSQPPANQLVFSSYFGGSGGEAAYGVTVDSSGNAYFVGQAGPTNFLVTTNNFSQFYGNGEGTYTGGKRNYFVLQISPSNTAQVGVSQISILSCAG
ncbi:MAG: SBBP repeat-containing protein, partial [Terriglobia bacterium]